MAPSSSASSSSSKSIHETIQMMMKYIKTGDASDLGELGEYLGLTPSSNSTTFNPTLNPASSTTSTISTTLKAVQKPTNPIFKTDAYAISHLGSDRMHTVRPCIVFITGTILFNDSIAIIYCLLFIYTYISINNIIK